MAVHELDWIVHLVETGEETQTGGRIKRLAPHIGNETFMLTWGDGVSNVDLDKLLDFTSPMENWLQSPPYDHQLDMVVWTWTALKWRVSRRNRS